MTELYFTTRMSITFNIYQQEARNGVFSGCQNDPLSAEGETDATESRIRLQRTSGPGPHRHLTYGNSRPGTCGTGDTFICHFNRY